MSRRAERTKRERLLWERWGKRIRAARGERTQTWLAGELGVDQATVSKWESGDLAPTDAMKFALAEKLGRAVEELFEWPAHMPPEAGANWPPKARAAS